MIKSVHAASHCIKMTYFLAVFHLFRSRQTIRWSNVTVFAAACRVWAIHGRQRFPKRSCFSIQPIFWISLNHIKCGTILQPLWKKGEKKTWGISWLMLIACVFTNHFSMSFSQSIHVLVLLDQRSVCLANTVGIWTWDPCLQRPGLV